jgi:ZIP family zinc transporter/zinc and cadmium transporter
VFILVNEKWTLRNSHYVNSFAAGAILAIAFFHLLPESVELNKGALLFVLAGFLALYALESVVVIHSGSEIHFHEQHEQGAHTKGMVIFSGVLTHAIIDGTIIGVGFEIDETLGLVTALGIILHKLAEGATTFAILINAMARRRALILSLVVASATFFGALLTFLFVKDLSEPTMGALLAIAGGTFLYISASDLIPETHRGQGFRQALVLFLGVIFMAFISRAIGE